jgi:hypothetical protein
MKLIIAGGRDKRLTQKDIWELSQLHALYDVMEVVSGGCTGVDQGGEEWAAYGGIPVKVMKADWVKHGKAAGPIRNREMAAYADALAAFAGGSGTENMKLEAKRAGLKVFDFTKMSLIKG